MKPNLFAGLMLCTSLCNLYAAENADSVSTDSLAFQLNEFVVNGKRPMAKMTADGYTVNILNSYLSHTGTAFDLLGKMPMVIAQSGSLTVLGKGTPLVYINGRKVYDLKELEQLQSDQIKKVDVVTAPEARYNGSVNAVIRIKTIAPIGEGFSLNDNTTAGYRHYAYLIENLGLNWRRGGFDAFVQLNLEDNRNRASFDSHISEYFTNNTVSKALIGTNKYKRPLYSGRAGANYTCDSFSAGVFYHFTFRPHSSATASATFRRTATEEENILNTSATNQYERRHMMSAYANGEFGKWKLSANFDAIWTDNDEISHQTDESDLSGMRNFNTGNPIDNSFFAANATADYKVWKGQVTFGGEWYDISRHEIYLADANYITGNDTRIDETNTAVFAEATQTFGDFNIRAGLRWEYIDTQYRLDGQLCKEQSRDYSQFFPSASLNYQWEQVELRLSYGHSTSRPLFGQLSSAVRYQDRYTFETGNPYLKPIYRDYISLTGQWKDLFTEVGFRSTKNYFMWQTHPYDDVAGATLTRMENMPRFGSFWAMSQWAPSFGFWSPMFMAGIEAPDFTIEHRGKPLKLNKPMGFFCFNNAIRLPADIWLNIDFSASTSGNSENLYVKSTWSMNTALYHSFLNGDLSLRLQLNDVFNTRRSEFTIYDALSRLQTVKSFDTRDFRLSVRYKFNVARSRYKGKGAATAEQQRL